MSGAAKQEYLIAIKPRYRKASRKEKQAVLDEVCVMCQYNREYAIRVLSGVSQPRHGKNLSRRGRKKQYSDPVILEVIKKLWVATNLPCSKRLKAIIPVWHRG